MNNRKTKTSQEIVLQQNDVADYICTYLEKIGIEYVFGIPGGSLEPFYSSLARSQKRGGITPVISRHESGAAFMADGYARETGKLGVCCATTGPGATNMITGVASAYQDNTPLLVITAQSSLHTFGKGAVQESSCTGINTLGMYAFCTRYNSLISHENQIEYKLHAAVQAAYYGPVKGPAHLSIPIDVFRKNINANNSAVAKPLGDDQRLIYDISAVNQLIQRLKNSRKVVFLVGVAANGALGPILESAKLLNAPLLCTPEAKGLINSYHPAFYGVYGFAGHSTAHDIITDNEVDTIVAIGTKLDEHTTSGWNTDEILNNKLIHIDNNTEHFFQSPMSTLQVYGTINEVFNQLNQGLGAPATSSVSTLASFKRSNDKPQKKSNPPLAYILKDRSHLRIVEDMRNDAQTDQQAYRYRNFSLIDEEKCFSNDAPIKPQRLMFELSRLFPPCTRYAAEIGNSFLWAIHYLQPKDRRITGERSSSVGLLRIGMGYSSMGWAIGGAIGTALGCHGKNPVVAIVGDGSLLMNGQELTVASEHHLPVIFVVLNDGVYGTVKHGQIMTKAEPIGYRLPSVDFMKMARAMGITAHTIYSPDDLLALNIDAMCQRDGPTLLDVHIDKKEVPPLGSRVKVLSADLEKG